MNRGFRDMFIAKGWLGILAFKVLNQQGDFYFGKDNWYTTKIYVHENYETITYLMEVVGV